MRVRAGIDEFREWLEERGYADRMGKEGIDAFLSSGFPSLFFTNSNLLYAFIYSRIGLGSERVNEKVRFELAKRINAIFIERDYFEMEFTE